MEEFDGGGNWSFVKVMIFLRKLQFQERNFLFTRYEKYLKD